ncbi:hypothetical protein Sjap_021441 [Stephania japonica]|uniref:Uncharacterized protein n=1 Tax=Stephania japonica TaxID=461633 RepID=A0AAP0EMD7_9MAGN
MQGLRMMTFSVMNHSSSLPSSLEVIFFFTSLYIVAIAQAGRKPCAQAFAADQFDVQDPSERRLKSSFFDWWYCALSTGMALSLILSYIQENLGWPLIFGIPCVFIVVSLLLFLVGSKTYKYNVKQNQTRNWSSKPSFSIIQEHEYIKQYGFSKEYRTTSQSNRSKCEIQISSHMVHMHNLPKHLCSNINTIHQARQHHGQKHRPKPPNPSCLTLFSSTSPPSSLCLSTIEFLFRSQGNSPGDNQESLPFKEWDLVCSYLS